MSAMPGPENGILLKEGDNPDGDVGKLYFPATETFIHIAPEIFGDEDRYDFLVWSEKGRRIIVSDYSDLVAVPVGEAREGDHEAVRVAIGQVFDTHIGAPLKVLDRGDLGRQGGKGQFDGLDLAGGRRIFEGE